MFVPFNQLPESARIWIYRANRKLNTAEQAGVSEQLRMFTEHWKAHGKPMRASFTIVHHQFIVLAADESAQPASGCSIDESVRVIKEIDQQFSLQLFDRTTVAFFQNETVVTVAATALQSSLTENKWTANSLVFDTTVTTLGDFKYRFIVPAANTWLKRYLHKVEA